MLNLKEVFFGYADADTEANRNPTLFQEVFFDPHDHLKELVHGDIFMVRGRKGEGKTAYGARIRLLSGEGEICSLQRSLNNFNNATFSQITTQGSMGGNRYISFWKCILAIECARMLHQCEPHIQESGFLDIVDALRRHGLIEEESDISVTISKLVETNSTFQLKSLFSHGRKYEKEETLQGAEQIYFSISRVLRPLYLQKKFILIVDGLDDILHNSEFRPEIITGLIRATEEINSFFAKSTLSLKILILIRDDILSMCRDPNLSKIMRDSSFKLSWSINDNPWESDLLQLVGKRIDAVTGRENSFEQAWGEIFPDNIHGKSTLSYVLDNIIYRPRDILQFFLEAQKEFVQGRKFTVDKVWTILFNYSNEYFLDAMKDELTGFFPDGAINMLPNLFMRLGQQYFYLPKFEEECRKYAEFEGVVTRDMFEKLFVAGYIGQRRPRDATTDRTVFSYRNPQERFQEDHECIIHRGLMRALTI